MITVEHLIGELLLRHNCVIIPSFGGFVARQSSAVIDYKNGVISPPKKALLFNRQLVNNDGLLVSELASSKQVSYDAANEEVKGCVVDWNEQLRKGERVSIDKVGFLFLDAEKNICFEQDRFFNLLLQSYGLGKVHFITESDIKRVEYTHNQLAQVLEVSSEPVLSNEMVLPVEHSVQAIPTSSMIQHPALEKRSSLWKYIAAACFIPLGFYSYWLPMRTNFLESGIISLQDFNPFYRQKEANYHQKALTIHFQKTDFVPLEESVKALPKEVKVYSYKYAEDLYIPVQVKKKANRIAAPEVVQHTAARETQPFDYIVGCFSNEQNAQQVLIQLKAKGMDAHVSKRNGLFRVSAGSAATEGEIQRVAQAAIQAGMSGWVAKNQ